MAPRQPLPTRRHLLPYERWFAGAVLERQSAAARTGSSKLLRLYGPEGTLLYAAGLATMLPGMAIGVIGAAVLLAFVDNSLLYHVGVWIAISGIAIIACSILRLTQAAQAGRAFRSRPPGYGRPAP